MDIQQQIVDALTNISDRQHANHLEVCQRLTTLETQIALQSPIEERVKALEGWRSKIIGFTVAANMAFAGLLAWVRHPVK